MGNGVLFVTMIGMKMMPLWFVRNLAIERPPVQQHQESLGVAPRTNPSGWTMWPVLVLNPISATAAVTGGAIITATILRMLELCAKVLNYFYEY